MARETKAQVAAREKASAINWLKQLFDSGTAVREISTVLVHVSRSGMMRVIQPLVVTNGSIVDITPTVAKITGWGIHPKRYGIVVNGCGMDMGFHLVYSISATLYGHADQGGYKIKHRWI